MPTFSATSTGRFGSVQNFTAPSTGDYVMTARGARGGYAWLDNTSTANPGGYGTSMSGTFALTAGDVIRLMIGQPGENNPTSQRGAGGGGATFVYNATTNTLLLIAGGGGGAGQYSSSGKNANIGSSGSAGTIGNFGAGGSAPSGGNAGQYSGGGGGYSGNGVSSGYATGGLSYTSGGTGGALSNDGVYGGYGGGGGSYAGGGGGGGYGGGGGGGWSMSGDGGGGGSYNSGSNQSNTTTSAPATVIITPPPNTAPTTVVTAPADNTSVPLTAGVDFTYTYTDAETNPQTGYVFKRRPVSFDNGLLVYGAEEWWDGSVWVGSMLEVASTAQPISISFWSSDFDTYQYSIATSDGTELSEYTPWRTLNPYEWWSGTAWTPMVESWVYSSEDQFTVPEGAVAMDGDSYEWAAATRDTVNLTGPYSGFATFTVSEGVKLYDGTDWADYAIRIYNGSSWGNYRTRIYNGTEWVDH
jgi:hypothetical protein